MVRLEEQKKDTEHKAIEKLPLPARVYVPLSQHIGKICSPLVKIGDLVKAGQKIGAADSGVYASVHSSVSGKVIAIEEWPHSVLARCKAIAIESDGLDQKAQESGRKAEEIEKLTADEIRNIVFEAGIVGMGGATFPTHIKLNPPKPIDTLIINGAECEPYLNSDNRLMIERAKEILLGIDLTVKCTGAQKAYIAIEDNKPEAIEKFRSQVIPRLRSGQAGHRSQVKALQIKVLKSQYPQGGEKQLISNILRREVPSGKLPFDIGVVVHNVATIFAIYEAVYKNKPLYERIVTVTGSCLSNPKNLLARIGTPIKELIDFCGPLKEEPAKIIIGGPMMGFAQYSTDVPVIKSTNGIVLLNKKQAKTQEEDFCIRCGACIRACPSGLMPCLINLASEKEMWTEAKAYNALDCIECGLCNYVCPANRRLTQSTKRAKLELAK